MTYAEKLKDPRWQKKRLDIMSRDEFKCQYCGDVETTLHIHHLAYTGNPWDASNDDLITACEHCHYVISKIMDGEECKAHMCSKFRFDNGTHLLFFSACDNTFISIFDEGRCPYSFKINSSDVGYLMVSLGSHQTHRHKPEGLKEIIGHVLNPDDGSYFQTLVEEVKNG